MNVPRPTTISLALDLGTTTLAGRLLTRDGEVLAESRARNPQAQLGTDVIRRLEAALRGDGPRLQQLLVTGINALVDTLLLQAQMERSSIAAAAAAANPAITILLRGDDPRPILFPPHRPRNRSAILLSPSSLGLDLPGPLYLFPLVSGYVGGDLVAFLYGQIEEGNGDSIRPPVFYVDIGTNAEMALHANGAWWVTSVAAGPAFEGGGITCGMPAEDGAIAGVRLADDRLQLEVIGGGRPQGICGSGLAEAIAAGLAGGLIDRRGRIVTPPEVPTNLGRYLTVQGDVQAICLYRDAWSEIVLSQADVRTFQLAKGALRAGVECLLERAGVTAAAVGRTLVTGAFGLSLPAETLKSIAMLPADMIEKSLFIPHGALSGVSRSLCSTDACATVQKLAGRLKPYPLSGTSVFERAFLAALDF